MSTTDEEKGAAIREVTKADIKEINSSKYITFNLYRDAKYNWINISLCVDKQGDNKQKTGVEQPRI